MFEEYFILHKTYKIYMWVQYYGNSVKNSILYINGRKSNLKICVFFYTFLKLKYRLVPKYLQNYCFITIIICVTNNNI